MEMNGERGSVEMGRDGYLPLFETKVAKGRILYRCYAASVFVGIIFIWVYRVVHFPPAGAQLLRRWAWMGLFLSELLFSFYWFLTQLVRWSPIYRYTFKDRLSQRFFQSFSPSSCFYLHLLMAHSEISLQI